MRKLIALITLLLSTLSIYAESYSVFYKGDSCGLIDENRKIISAPVYEFIRITVQGCFECVKSDGAVDFFDEKFNKVFSFSYVTFMWQYSEHEWIIHKNGEIGLTLIDIKTKQTTKGIEVKSKDNCPTFINNIGVILTYYDEMQKYGYTIATRNGKTIVSNIAQADMMYSEDLIPVLFFNGKSGYLDYEGNLVIEVPLYEDYRMEGLRISPSLNYRFHEGVAFIQTAEDQWYLLDKKGSKKEVPPEYNFATRRYSKGLTVVEDKEHKFGYMDKDFKLAIPCKFERAESFEGKYAAVVYQGKDGVIDKDGNIYFCEEFK